MMRCKKEKWEHVVSSQLIFTHTYVHMYLLLIIIMNSPFTNIIRKLNAPCETYSMEKGRKETL
jgi:hypothetical protein